METLKERIWGKATTELNPKFQDTERNFEYEEPIIDLTLKEVLDLIDNWYNRCLSKKDILYSETVEKLKSAIKGRITNK